MATPARITSAALVLAAALLLPACSSSDQVDKRPSVATSTSTSPSPNSSPTARAVGLDQPFRTADGVVAEITEIKNAKLPALPVTDDPKAKEGDPYVLLVVTMTNKSASTVELVPTAVLTYGPEKTRALEVNVGQEIEGPVLLKPAQAYKFALGFLIPNESRDQVAMEFTISIEPLRTAFFAGSIAPA